MALKKLLIQYLLIFQLSYQKVQDHQKDSKPLLKISKNIKLVISY
jgi:hypothetical protein